MPLADSTASDTPANEKPQPSPVTTTELPSNPALITTPTDEPWTKSLAAGVAPWTRDSPRLTADFKSAGHDELTDVEARRWLEPVAGQPCEWSTELIGKPTRRVARFHGLARLRAPWPTDAVLRLTPFDVTDLTLYFWNGLTGTAFHYDTARQTPRWTAFEMTRPDSTAKPVRGGLLTTDNGAYVRSTPGTLDIRQQDNELILARGDVILMSVPQSGSPTEVVIEGQFRLRGISMYRGAPLHHRADNSQPSLISGPAATLPWMIPTAGHARLTSNADGSISMAAESSETMETISLPWTGSQERESALPTSGMFETIICVESADPGTGFFLGDHAGRPLQRLGFFRDVSTQEITFGLLHPDELRTDSLPASNESVPLVLATSVWLKLVSGLGVVHVLASGDGRHWGDLTEDVAREAANRDVQGTVGSLGLFSLPGPHARTIRIRHIQVRELRAITDLVDPALRQSVTPFTADQLQDPTTWIRRINEVRPAAVDESRWLAANVVVALSQDPPKEFAATLLHRLVTIGIKSTRSFEQKCELLQQAGLLCAPLDETTAKLTEGWYEELGWQLAESDDPIGLPKLRSAWLRTPIETKHRMPSVCERLHSHAIIQAIYRHDWPTVWSLAQSVSYWIQPANPDAPLSESAEQLDRHARWAQSLVAETVPQLDDGTAAVMPARLRHPFIPIFNKAAYNLRAELQAALADGNDEDACRIAMSIDPGDVQGLLPEIDDRDLFVSLPTALAIARKSSAGFAATMAQKFAPYGLIRVRAAINRRNIPALQAATLQFMGTDAAREAHAWLGDLNLSVGQFGTAEQHFCDALVEASDQQREALEPRLMLARALGGRLPYTSSIDSPFFSSARPVEFNGQSISATDFRSLISTLNTRITTVDAGKETGHPSVSSVPQGAFTLEHRAAFSGDLGNNPGRWEYRFGDPFGRQLTVATDGRQAYASNRFQVTAYSTITGQQLWTHGLGNEQGNAYALPFTPMRPLLSGDRLFVRRLTKAGVELAALNTNHGHLVWRRQSPDSVLTDPTFWNGQLFALLVSKRDDDQVQVEAAWFDPKNGTVTATHPLFRLREFPDHQYSGQLVVNDRFAVCTVGGTTACFDWQGQIRWLRRHILLRSPVDELAEDFRVSRPAIKDDRVIVTMPGVRELQCLNLETGRTIWERPITHLRGLAGITGSNVIADTTRGLEAVDATTGKLLWRYPLPSRLEVFQTDEQTVLLAKRAESTDNKSKPLLIWLDAQSGRELDQSMVEVKGREQFQLGPLFSANGKWWSFVGESWRNPQRELHELIRIPTAASE